MGKRENGYSKEEFQQFLEQKIIKDLEIMGKPAKRAAQAKPGAYIFMGMGLLLLSLPILDPGGVKGDFFTGVILMELGGLGFFIPGMIFHTRIQIYESLEKFFELKELVISERGGLESIISSDMESTGINMSILGDIKKLILSILDSYKLISKSHQYIQGHMWYFGKIPQEGQDIINTELQWIINYSQEFTLLVQSWTSHHATELAELEKQIESQEFSTENGGGKAALGLQRLSLQEHLKELEKVRD